MKVHYLQHVPFEGLGSIESFLSSRNHSISATQLYLQAELPDINDFDWLIVMGGPMGVNDESSYSWLNQEKEFIKEAIDAGKIVLGICLGAQLIASVLGAKVIKNNDKEIGWFQIKRADELKNTILSSSIPEQTEVFHWHGETFELPIGAIPIASSQACKNQGFIINNQVVGFQFHLETTTQSAGEIIKNCQHELDGSKFVQNQTQMMEAKRRFSDINKIMNNVLFALEKSQIKIAFE